MRKNRLGSSDLWVSEVGLGCMSLGTDEKQAIEIIHKALDLGINFLDTADLYDFGRNEELLGTALKKHRSNVIIATKVGNRWTNNKDSWSWDPSKKHIMSAVKESLRRLQTDYIDLYQLHGGTIDDNIDEAIDAFEQLKSEGLIRYYGISSIRPNVIREYVRRANIDSVMVQYSLIDRRPEEEVLPLLEQHGISAIARGPLAKGLLSGNLSKAKDGYLNYNEKDLTDMINNMRMLENEKTTVGQLSLRYALHHDAVATVIPGASSINQLIQNVSATNLEPLSTSELAFLQALTMNNKYESHR